MLSSSLVRSMPKNADIHRMAPRPPYPNTGPSTHRVYARVDSSASTTHKTEPKPVSLRPVYILTLCLHHMGESIVQNFSWVCTAGLPISYTFGLSMPYLFAVEIWFQIRHQFWIPRGKLHRACCLFFFAKPQNMLVWLCARFLCFLGGFRYNISRLSSKPFFTESNYRARNTWYNYVVRTYGFLMNSQKTLFYINYHLSARALNYRAHAHQLDFLKI